MSIPRSASTYPSISPPGPFGTSCIEGDSVEIVGGSNAMKRLRLQIRRIGPHFRSMLIRGEAGTGKELFARALHRLSRGAGDPFVRCHAGTLEGVLARRAGRGTIFLDAIDEMSLNAQDKLLRALEEHEYMQIIGASNEDVRILVSGGRLRPDLYQRLASVEITLPLLRERMEDVPELARYFLEQLALLYREEPRRIADGAMQWMQQYHWPGNVRELKEVLHDCVLQTKGRLLEAHHLMPLAEPEQSTRTRRNVRLQDVLEQHVMQVLKDCGGNKLRAAEMLGISRSTLYRMLGAGSLAENLH